MGLSSIFMKKGEVLYPGDTVRFTADILYDAQCIGLVGMFGTVMPDPYGVCTPGLTAMIQPIGTDWSFGFPCYVLEKVEGDLTEEDIAQSTHLAEHSFEIYHDRCGWTGLMKIKNKIKSADVVHKEIEQLCSKLKTEGFTDQTKGHIKRLVRILRAFKYHPDEAFLLGIADELSSLTLASHSKFFEILDKIAKWNEQTQRNSSNPVDGVKKLLKDVYGSIKS